MKLVADSHQGRREVSLKQPGNKCALFGSIGLFASDTENRKEAYVFLEAARGGDGDHSGPIVEVYQLNKQGFRKLGEEQIFEASYHRKGQSFVAVTGKVLFSFCDVCDGPESGDPEMDYYVPVSLTIGCGGICIRPTLSKEERAKLIAKFEARKTLALERPDTREQYRQFVFGLEHDFQEFLRR